MGPCVAGGAYLPVMCDKYIIVEGASMFLAGPALVKAAIGQEIDTDKLGDAVDGGGGGNIDITPIVMAIQGLQGDVVAMKTELKTSIDSSSKTIASEVVTGMDKATG